MELKQEARARAREQRDKVPLTNLRVLDRGLQSENRER
jgi:hypothetical protein